MLTAFGHTDQINHIRSRIVAPTLHIGLKMTRMRSVAANVQLLFHKGFSTNSSIPAPSIAPAPIPAVEPTREKRRISLSGWIGLRVVDTC